MKKGRHDIQIGDCEKGEIKTEIDRERYIERQRLCVLCERETERLRLSLEERETEIYN